MLTEQNDVSGGSGPPRAKTQRMIKLSRAERATTDRPICPDALQGGVAGGHEVRSHGAEPDETPVLKHVSPVMSATYSITSCATDPETWVLACTHAETGASTQIVICETLPEAQYLLDRLMNARALKANRQQ